MSAPQADRQPRKASRISRWALVLGGLVVCLLLAATVAYLGRERWITPLVRERAAAMLREQTGLELRFSRLGGNWYDVVVLEDLALEGGTPTGPLTRASLSSLRVSFELWPLIRGQLSGITAISASSARIDIDLDREQAAPAMPRPRAAPIPWPERLPSLDLRDVDVQVHLAPGRELELEGMQVKSSAQSAAADSSLELRARRAAFSDPELGPREAALSARVGYRAGLLSSPALVFDDAVLARELELDLREIERERLHFEGTLDLFGGSTQLRGSLADKSLGLFAAVERVEVAALLRELGSASSLSATADLNLQLHLPLSNTANWSAQTWGSLESLEFGGRRFELGSFQGSLARDRVELRELELWCGANRLRCRNFGCSLGERGLDAILRSLTGTAEVELLDPGRLLGDAPEAVRRAALRVQRAHLQLGFSAMGMAVGAGELVSEAGGLTIQRGRALWGPRDRPWYEGLDLDLDLILAFNDLAPLAALFGRGDVFGALEGTVQLRGPALAPSGSFMLAGEGIRVADLGLGRVAIEALADRRRLAVQRLEVDGELGRASVSGEFDYASGRLSKSSIELRTAALAALSQGRASAALVAIDAALEGDWRAPAVWATLHAFELELQGRRIERIELEADGSSRLARLLRCAGVVEGVEFDLAGSLRHSAAWERWQIRLERAQLAQQQLALELEAPLEFEFSAQQVLLRGLCLGGSAGRATADFSWTPSEQSLALDAEELRPMQLLRPFLPADMSIEGVRGSLEYHHSLQVSKAQARLYVDSLRMFGTAPAAALQFESSWDGARLSIDRLELRSGEHYGFSLRGELPTDPLARDWLGAGALRLEGGLSVADLSQLPWERLGSSSEWSGSLDTRFELGGSSSDVSGRIDAHIVVDGSAPDSPLRGAKLDELRFDGRLTLGEGLRLQRARFGAPERFSAVVDAQLPLRVDPRGWLRGEALDWRSLALELRARIVSQDLAFVAGLTPKLRRTGGQLQGDLLVSGSLGDLHPRGNFELIGGELRMANALAGFEQLAAQVVVDGSSLQVVSLSGEYGAAPFSASGKLDFAGHEPQLEFQLQGKNLLLAREEGLRLRADAELALRGPLSALALTGELLLVEGRYSKNFELLPLPSSKQGPRPREFALPFLRQAPWSDLELDVRVRAERPVRIETNIVTGTVEPRLHLRGSGSAPRLGGSILVGPMRVRLPASSLQVNTGVVTFDDETSLVPRLNISATTRLRGHDVTAQVSGTSSEPEIFFSSSPPLASEEIAVLVLTGQLPESALTGSGGAAAAQTMVTYLGEDLLTRWLGQAEGGSEDPLSERLEFAYGVEVSDSGVESTEVVFRLTPRPRGKSRVVYLRAERDIYERINFGVKLSFRFR